MNDDTNQTQAMKVQPRKVVIIKKPPTVMRRITEADKDKFLPIDELITKFHRVFDSINKVIFGRSDEVRAVKLCILTGNHILLLGKHGVAKSRFAHEVFSRITGDELVVFKKQFMKGTQTDEVFGPMNSKVYREEARWEHNITGMLPSAHFAFLDEVYRAADSVLPSMMGVINERTFMNGPIEVKCPLITAIGTTNFISDNMELDAFHDRWIVKANVSPLGDRSARVKMLQSIYSFEDQDDVETISLAEIQYLRSFVRHTMMFPQALELYNDLIHAFKGSDSAMYISDRRFVETFKLVQADALLHSQLEGTGNHVSLTLKPDNLAASKYGMIFAGDDTSQQAEAYFQAYQEIVGNYALTIQEAIDTEKIVSYSTSLVSEYDETMPAKAKVDLYVKTKRAYKNIATADPDKKPQKKENIEALEKAAERLGSLIATMHEDPVLLKTLKKVRDSSKPIIKKNGEEEDSNAEPILDSEGNVVIQPKRSKSNPDGDLVDPPVKASKKHPFWPRAYEEGETQEAVDPIYPQGIPRPDDR